jgi:hypothetical protein
MDRHVLANPRQITRIRVLVEPCAPLREDLDRGIQGPGTVIREVHRVLTM